MQVNLPLFLVLIFMVVSLRFWPTETARNKNVCRSLKWATRYHMPVLRKMDETVCLRVKVKTRQGWIEGRKVRSKTTAAEYDEYLGIRYAQTPRRFERPQYPPSSWLGVFQATEYPPQCPWIYWEPWVNTSLSEDCLFLNVYVPRGKEWTGRRHPVLVLIHPGGFEVGNANTLGHKAWTRRGVIVVSIAYRLGVFGWASSANSVLPGNLGLWDQNSALKWTHDNIVFFNGDKERITLSGFSAGGVSAMAHLLSPASKGLFKRVIAVSGSASSNWGTKIPCTEHKRYASWIKNFARALNCSGDSDQENIKCMQKVSMMDLVNVSHMSENMDYRAPDDRWSPVVDREFFPAPPKKLYAYLEHSEIDLMVGSGYHDGRTYVSFDYKEPRPHVNSVEEYYRWRYDVSYHFGDLVRNQAFEYYGIKPTANPLSEQYTLMFTHQTYAATQELDATAHARYNGGRVYSFVWRHRPSFSDYEDWMAGDHKELLYFWSAYLTENVGVFNPSQEELQHVQDLIDYQANFIDTGDPNSGRQVVKFWPRYEGSSLSKQVMEFRVPTKKSKPINNYWGNKAKFWADLWEKSYGEEDLVCA